MKETETLVATIPGAAAIMEEEVSEQRLSTEVSDIETRAKAVVITTEEEYQEAASFGTDLKRKTKQVMEFFKPMKDSAYKAHQEVVSREKAMLAPLREAENIIKRAMASYIQEKERKARELEEARRRAAEAERERILKEAEKLESSGDKEAAEAAMKDAIVMDNATHMTVSAPAKPKATGVSSTKDWEIVEVDDKKVPLEVSGTTIRPVDLAAVMRLIRATKGTISIPGISYRETTRMSFRG